MTNITLQPLTTVADSGHGEAVEVGPRSSLKLRAIVADLEGDTVSIAVETSPDGLVWRSVESIVIDVACSMELAVIDLDRFVRVAWTLTGSYATLAVTGVVRQLYATVKDLEFLNLGPIILQNSDSQKLNRALMHASDVAAGYLGGQYDLPLLSWGDDLAGHTASVAAYRFMVSIGYAPEGADEHIRTMYEDAIRWFERVSEGKISPEGIVDSTPEESSGGAFVYTRSLRGW